MLSGNVRDLPRPAGPAPADIEREAGLKRNFAQPPPCPRCEFIEHQTQLKLNTYQKVYKKKLDEAQHSAGRWKSDYYQIREKLYKLQSRHNIRHQLPAVVLGCILGVLARSEPGKQAGSWLASLCKRINPFSRTPKSAGDQQGAQAPEAAQSLAADIGPTTPAA